jgi:hypothetical protein
MAEAVPSSLKNAERIAVAASAVDANEFRAPAVADGYRRLPLSCPPCFKS